MLVIYCASPNQPRLLHYLGEHVDLGSLAQEQSSHVGMALLGGQMERRDPLLCQDVGLSSVLQQNCGYFHLVLLGCDVERSVAVLIHEDTGEKMVSVVTMVSVTLFHIYYSAAQNTHYSKCGPLKIAKA